MTMDYKIVRLIGRMQAIILLCIVISGFSGLLYAQYEDEEKLVLQHYKLPKDALPDSLMVEKDSVLYLKGKPFTGTAFSTYDNGKLQHAAIYKDGWKHGAMYVWYPDGKPQLLSNYRNGHLDGRFKGWYQFGAVIYDLVMRGSRYNGDQLYNADSTRAETSPEADDKTGDVVDKGND